MRYLMVDGQGNFGSVDGDPPAAMRYTEARLAPVSEAMLRDIEKDTVDFGPNYDDSLTEPAVLPAAFPYLLANGASGIAVGMATNIPPHNLIEVAGATLALIGDPKLTNRDLMKHVRGPDFPTGGIIFGRKGIEDAYTTGKGKIVVRARVAIEPISGGREAIIVDELPYQVNKANLIVRIAGLVKERRLEGISDLRDESDRRGMRIVIEIGPPLRRQDRAQPAVQPDPAAGRVPRQRAGAGGRQAAGAHPARHAARVHRAPQEGGDPPRPLRPQEGRAARPHPGRAEDRPRQHRRGGAHHPRQPYGGDGSQRTAGALRAVGGAGAGDSGHAPAAAHQPGNAQGGGGAGAGARAAGRVARAAGQRAEDTGRGEEGDPGNRQTLRRRPPYRDCRNRGRGLQLRRPDRGGGHGGGDLQPRHHQAHPVGQLPAPDPRRQGRRHPPARHRFHHPDVHRLHPPPRAVHHQRRARLLAQSARAAGAHSADRRPGYPRAAADGG